MKSKQKPKSRLDYHIWRNALVDFIDKNYPKGDEERGMAVVHIALFMIFMEKRLNRIFRNKK
jgi:hypothetical protein